MTFVPGTYRNIYGEQFAAFFKATDRADGQELIVLLSRATGLWFVVTAKEFNSYTKDDKKLYTLRQEFLPSDLDHLTQLKELYCHQ